jgi:exopolysaccharide biosynthesis polyprenyl glycosylphosphotransferase
MGVVLATLTAGHEAAAAVELFLCAALTGSLVARRLIPLAALLPFARTLLSALAPVAGVAAFLAVRALESGGAPPLRALAPTVLVGVAVAVAGGVLPPRRARRARPRRTAVIGSQASAEALARELRDERRTSAYDLVGRIGDDPSRSSGEVPWLGTLKGLGDVVDANDVDLLVLSADAPRLRAFEAFAASCLDRPVSLWELTALYESTFGHVPAAEINAAWFQYLGHPSYRRGMPAGKRALDVVVAVTALVVLWPLLAVLALLVRADGGPALFRQRRIGEAGRPMTVFKLRTMRPGTGHDVQWATEGDPRITRVGRLLRRSHLDELPQFLNVLRGDMTLVGPRPEQPEIVVRLERWLPYYERRHLIRPGLTGWAQVRCGYAGTDLGAAWKLCHDLYYLKHRSPLFDLVILSETLRTVVADRGQCVEPSGTGYLVAAPTTPGPAPTAPSAAASAALAEVARPAEPSEDALIEGAAS